MPGRRLTTPEIPLLICIGCGKSPDQLQEYIDAGKENDMTPEQYC